MQLNECERLSLRTLLDLPCGNTPSCFFPTICDNVPEGRTHSDFEKEAKKSYKKRFYNYVAINCNVKTKEAVSTIKTRRNRVSE